MEEFSAVEQMQMASEWDLLVRGHGNRLSHMLWMRSKRYVLELLWNFPFQFDYAASAQLLHHHHVALLNGQRVDSDSVASCNGTLLKYPWELSEVKEDDQQNLIQEGIQNMQAGE